MSDFARLNEKLGKLRQKETVSGKGRKLKGDDAEARIAALVTEIDETILPRRLTLTSGKNALHLAVANRRLQAVLAPAPKTKGASELEGKELPDAEDPGVPALHKVLTDFLGGKSTATVATRRLETTFGSDIGVPANLLGRAWGVELNAGPKQMDPSEVLAKFLGDVGDLSIAWLKIAGEEVADQSGDEARLADLGEQAVMFLDSYFSKFDELYATASFACGTLIAPKDGDAMFFVEIGEISAFVAIEAKNAGAVAQLWQSLVSE